VYVLVSQDGESELGYRVFVYLLAGKVEEPCVAKGSQDCGRCSIRRILRVK